MPGIVPLTSSSQQPYEVDVLLYEEYRINSYKSTH